MLHEFSRPGALEDLERLVEHPCALGFVQLLTRDRVFAAEPVAAEADAERQPAIAEPIEGRGLARHLDRPAPCEWGDHRAEPDALGRAGDSGQRDLCVGHVDNGLVPTYVVPHEHPVPAGLLGLRGQPRNERGIGKLVEERDVERGAHAATVRKPPVSSHRGPLCDSLRRKQTYRRRGASGVGLVRLRAAVRVVASILRSGAEPACATVLSRAERHPGRCSRSAAELEDVIVSALP